MALLKCVECGGTISDSAKVCPHCGKPVNLNDYMTEDDLKEKARKKNNAIVILVLIVLICIIIGVVYGVEKYNEHKVKEDIARALNEGGFYEKLQESADEYSEKTDKIIDDLKEEEKRRKEEQNNK